MFSNSEDEYENDEFGSADVVGIFMKLIKYGAIVAAALCLLVAPALVVYCRFGADADANGVVTRAEYDANVTTIIGTGILSYLKPVMAFWERVVFLVLPVTESETPES